MKEDKAYFFRQFKESWDRYKTSEIYGRVNSWTDALALTAWFHKALHNMVAIT